jgi:glycosyltransferase involved in cell wall biosynthesis
MTRAARTILILIATERVSGPLKGILQYIRYLDRARWQPLLGFVRNRGETQSEAELEAQCNDVPFVVLEQSRAFDWRLIGKARRIAMERQVSLVQSHGYKTHVIAFFIKLLVRLPWVGFEHGWTAENWRVRLYHRAGWVLRYADRVVVVSDVLRRALERLGIPAAKLVTLRNAVEQTDAASSEPRGVFRRAHGIPADVPLVAVIGRISAEKGQRTFVEAFRLLSTAVPQAHAVLVGDGVDADYIRGYVADRGLTGAVHLVGHQWPVAPVYWDADVIVIPSESEGISNVLLEAMAAGRPVVATAVGGTPEVLTHARNGLLVPASDPVAMADAIAIVLQDNTLRDRLVEDARHHVLARHSPVERSERIRAVYESLLS